jgi:predicted O-linked N-acetylglucosamine transferase (SPINDLY family)
LIANAASKSAAEALNNRGNALRSLGRHPEAIESFNRALANDPRYVEAICNRGIALAAANQWEKAIADYDAALAINPSYVHAHYNRGNALQALERHEDAVASYRKALTLAPSYVEALGNCGFSLLRLQRHDEALAAHEKALAIEPRHPKSQAALLECTLNICDWSRTAALLPELRTRIGEATLTVPPFLTLSLFSEPALHLECANRFAKENIPAPPIRLWTGRTWRNDRIRLAYLSSDFRRHPIPYLTARIFELHDRSRFEVHGVSFGPDDGSEIRRRLIKGFDRFHDARSVADGEVARHLNELAVDIAIDLNGHTPDGRPGRVLAHRPAPIQVNFLGYPGTMGANFVDYILADPIVLPMDQQRFHSEKIVQLPECYQPNDSQRRIAERTPSRAEAGLPAHGFVFCCFNNNYKIMPPIFDVWMRLLRAVDGSVLWLLSDNEFAAQNLRKEAAVRGVDPTRLVFAERTNLEDHLARHRLASLFVDTLPYNAHITASDALWAGLPLVTCCGAAFSSRVAASLLSAVGLPELVTGSLEAYEALALRLANDPALLGGLRAKLERNRLEHPLFDSQRFCRHIESAYATMWEQWQSGEPPQSFAVAPISSAG